MDSKRRLRGVMLALLAAAMAVAAPGSAGAALPAGFQESTAFSGLTNPTVVRFASDGRVFVAEQTGRIKVFDDLQDPSPTLFADLSGRVQHFWDRGMLGMALDPQFPTRPYVYVSYTHDAAIGGTAPRWGDTCPTPPGATGDGCVVSGRLSKLTASGSVMTGPEQVLIEDWCQQYPSHSIGALAFGPDGALYMSGGDGASFGFGDYGQDGSPLNPCGDPPTGVGGTQTIPTAEGGALRSQDLRTGGDPVSLDGSVIRVNPDTGAALPDNPLAGNADANARRIVAYGLRNPFRFTFRPGTSELWIGDVGWGNWEEIDRVVNPLAATLTNFGWPCREGPNDLGNYRDLNICIGLPDRRHHGAPLHLPAQRQGGGRRDLRHRHLVDLGPGVLQRRLLPGRLQRRALLRRLLAQLHLGDVPRHRRRAQSGHPPDVPRPGGGSGGPRGGPRR